MRRQNGGQRLRFVCVGHVHVDPVRHDGCVEIIDGDTSVSADRGCDLTLQQILRRAQGHCIARE
jgi:hypothetical protein